jgi:hypothetical protein
VSAPADEDQELARLIGRSLRDLPLRRAPSTLEAHVLGELRRRAAQPWWRRSFSHWPPFARVAFGFASAALIGSAFAAGASLMDIVRSQPWARQAAALAGAAGQLGASLGRADPPTWIYEGLAVSALLYAALFGLGIAGYRTLYRNSALPRVLGP